MASRPQEEYMRGCLRAARALAVWPLDESAGSLARIGYRSVVCAATVVLSTIALSLVMRVLHSSEDMDGVATVVDFATVFISGVFRCVSVFVRGPAFSKMADTIAEEFTHESFNSGEKKTMERIRSLGIKVAAAYFIGTLSFIFQMVIMPPVAYLISDLTMVPLIFDSWAPFDLNVEPIHSVAFAFQALGVMYIGYMYLLFDSIIYYMIILAIGQLQLIAYSFQNVIPGKPKDMSRREEDMILGPQSEEVSEIDDLSFDISKEQLLVIKRCVEQHQRVRSFIQQMENLLSPIVIVDTLHAITSITFILMDILIGMDKRDWFRLFYLVGYLLVSIAHLFVFDYLGNELALQEQKLAEAIYSMPWYYAPLKVKTPVMLTIAASRRPIRLTGGKFYNLTLEFFVAAMRLIGSYFMVLYQLRNKREQ